MVKLSGRVRFSLMRGAISGRAKGMNVRLFLAVSLPAVALLDCQPLIAAEKKPGKAKDGARAEEIAKYYAAPLERLEFTIKAETLQQLRDDPRVYTEVKMSAAGKEWKGVAMKLKGSDGSFKP